MNSELTAHEIAYLTKVNTFGLVLLALHLPVLSAVAASNGNSWLLVLGVGLFLLAGPVLLLLRNRASELGGTVIAVSAMGLSALAIHAANGLIEAHFELFVLIALLTVFGRVLPVLTAGATIAVHHVVFWLWLPTSVFNYKASFAVVLLHAFFVVLEVIPCCWIARQFGLAVKAQGIVMESLANVADQVTQAAAEISSSSALIAQGASRQAASIEETTANAAEISQSARSNRENSSSAEALATASDSRFQETDSLLTDMVQAMSMIQNSSEKISRIVKVIDQIAFQTNILALNASVEAARAGEAGMGFSVVAEEVRNLAQRSATAAQDTAALIEESIGNSKAGMSVVTRVTAAIRSTTDDVSRVKEFVVKINAGSREQLEGINQVSTALHSVEAITQQNAAASEQTAAAAEQLTFQATSMKEIVLKLGRLANGQKEPQAA